MKFNLAKIAQTHIFCYVDTFNMVSLNLRHFLHVRFQRIFFKFIRIYADKICERKKSDSRHRYCYINVSVHASSFQANRKKSFPMKRARRNERPRVHCITNAPKICTSAALLCEFQVHYDFVIQTNINFVCICVINEPCSMYE